MYYNVEYVMWLPIYQRKCKQGLIRENHRCLSLMFPCSQLTPTLVEYNGHSNSGHLSLAQGDRYIRNALARCKLFTSQVFRSMVYSMHVLSRASFLLEIRSWSSKKASSVCYFCKCLMKVRNRRSFDQASPPRPCGN